MQVTINDFEFLGRRPSIRPVLHIHRYYHVRLSLSMCLSKTLFQHLSIIADSLYKDPTVLQLMDSIVLLEMLNLHSMELIGR